MKKMVLYIVLAYALTWLLVGVFLLLGGRYDSPFGPLLSMGCMWMPTVAVVVAQKYHKERPLRGLGLRGRFNRWWIVGWLFAPVLAFLALGLSGLVPGVHITVDNPTLSNVLDTLNAQTRGAFTFTPTFYLGISLINGLIAGITINAAFALGEEIGWRGYLLRLFEGKSFLSSAVIIGAVWGLWHMPLILLGHNYPHHPVLGVFMMIVFCVLVAPVVQYFRVKSRSLVVAAIVHGSINAFAGLPALFLSEYNELLVGTTGLAGFLALGLAVGALFLVDCYITRDHIFLRPLVFGQADEVSKN